MSGWDLDPGAVGFLAGLPTRWDAIIDGIRAAVRHGTPKSDMDGIYPDQATADDLRRWLDEAEADFLLVDHTHIPFRLELLGGRCAANAGALLRDPASAMDAAVLVDPTTGNSTRPPAPGGGTFGVLNLPSKQFRVFKAADGSKVGIMRKTLGIVDRRVG
ncbi:MAG: hypothetical protein EXR75_12325 [Myxococcales bacterium]|nr:hypothetical protein [Myxococcales bacterium]